MSPAGLDRNMSRSSGGIARHASRSSFEHSRHSKNAASFSGSSRASAMISSASVIGTNIMEYPLVGSDRQLVQYGSIPHQDNPGDQ